MEFKIQLLVSQKTLFLHDKNKIVNAEYEASQCSCRETHQTREYYIIWGKNFLISMQAIACGLKGCKQSNRQLNSHS
jgi:hypothetical protein